MLILTISNVSLTIIFRDTRDIDVQCTLGGDRLPDIERLWWLT